VELDALHGRVRAEDGVEEKMTALVGGKPDHSSCEYLRYRSSLIHTLSGIILLS
jgi:hypothetical protein